MDRLEAMSVLVAAVETGSLSAAGRKLGIPLPTVSRKLSELEAHLRTRLLNRTTRRLMLTEAGSAYLEASRRILDEVGNAERLAAGEYSEPRGHLAVTAPIVFGRLHVLPVITDFLAKFPQNRRAAQTFRPLRASDRRADRRCGAHRPAVRQQPQGDPRRCGALRHLRKPRLSGKAWHAENAEGSFGAGLHHLRRCGDRHRLELSKRAPRARQMQSVPDPFAAFGQYRRSRHRCRDRRCRRSRACCPTRPPKPWRGAS